MRRIDIQFLDRGFHRVLFDAMPIPIFVVDGDVSILDYNESAARLVGRNRRLVIRKRGGEVLRCVNSTETPEGCGHSPACRRCVVRASVRAAVRGHKVTRRLAEMELAGEGKPTRVKLRVSCQPFSYGKKSFVLLMLEGLND